MIPSKTVMMAYEQSLTIYKMNLEGNEGATWRENLKSQLHTVNI